MKNEYDPTLPIELLAEQVKLAVIIAGNVNQPYMAAQILSITYTLVFKTGVYKEACREWRNKPDGYKIWPKFKQHFVAAYANNLEETKAKNMGYGADAVQQ
eukprot:4601753-Ditylum_brightwellii.AAC.1